MLPHFHPFPSVTRRRFLRALGAGVAASLLPLGAYGQDANQPKGKKLKVRTAEPFNAEPELPSLVEDWITPVEFFYVRNHGKIPTNLEKFRLSVEGLVQKPVSLGVDELAGRFPAAKVTAALTCAGNRRSEFTGKPIKGVAWGAGAIGNARWAGIPLSALLKQAELKPGAKHVWFEGLDQIVDKNETFPFGGSISLEKALSDDAENPVLLATEMNGAPLTPEHGAPLRAIVPGYIGARSVKWLAKITVSDRPSPNHYLADAYKLIVEETRAALDAALPIYEYALNSVICSPAPQARLETGVIKVRGFALPGGAAGRTVKSVELSVDAGKTWNTIPLDKEKSSPFGWRLWSGEVAVAKETEALWVRATDSSGEVQPREMPWNAKGYQYNAWHRVPVTVS